jgi:hypothetical protein
VIVSPTPTVPSSFVVISADLLTSILGLGLIVRVVGSAPVSAVTVSPSSETSVILPSELVALAVALF